MADEDDQNSARNVRSIVEILEGDCLAILIQHDHSLDLLQDPNGWQGVSGIELTTELFGVVDCISIVLGERSARGVNGWFGDGRDGWSWCSRRFCDDVLWLIGCDGRSSSYFLVDGRRDRHLRSRLLSLSLSLSLVWFGLLGGSGERDYPLRLKGQEAKRIGEKGPQNHHKGNNEGEGKMFEVLTRETDLSGLKLKIGGGLGLF